MQDKEDGKGPPDVAGPPDRDWSSELAAAGGGAARGGGGLGDGGGPSGGGRRALCFWLAAGGCLSVVLLLGLGMTLFVPKLVESLVQAQQQVVRADLARLRNGLEAFQVERGAYPGSLEELVEDGGVDSGLAELPVDPWQRPYLYDPPSGGEPWRLRSLGADGEPGGELADEDVEIRGQ